MNNNRIARVKSKKGSYNCNVCGEFLDGNTALKKHLASKSHKSNCEKCDKEEETKDYDTQLIDAVIEENINKLEKLFSTRTEDLSIDYLSAAKDIADDQGNSSVIKLTQLALDCKVDYLSAAKDIADDQGNSSVIKLTQLALDCKIQNQKKVYIINYGKFTNGQTRLGSEHNSSNLSSTFTHLSYEVVVFEDKTLSETRVILDTIAEDNTLQGLLLIIISRGGWGGDTFRTSDMKRVSLCRDVIGRFSDARCPQLQGRSKVFITDYGRAHPDAPVKNLSVAKAAGLTHSTTTTTTSCSSGQVLPGQSVVATLPLTHTAIIHSTQDGYNTMGSSDKGSWFVHYFCEVLKAQPNISLHHAYEALFNKMKAQEMKFVGKLYVQLPAMEICPQVATFNF